MKRIKIGYVLTPVVFGGAEKVSLNFLANIDRNRFELIPVVLVRPWENSNYFLDKIIEMGFQYFVIPVAKISGNEKSDWFRVLRCFRRLLFFVRNKKINIIHTNGYFADIIGVSASIVSGIPHLATCHGFILNDFKLQIYNRLDLLFLKFSNRVIAVSEGIKNDLLRFGIREKKIFVNPNAVELIDDKQFFTRSRKEIQSACAISDGEIVLGYVGRLSYEKGLKYLIEAGEQLVSAGLPVRIIIVGEGDQRDELKAMAHKLGLDGRVVFAGFRKEVKNWLASFDLFILPSLTEGTPLALLEAMSCGIPVIASNVGGIPQVIESGENGILVTPARSDEIVTSVLKICRISGTDKKLSHNARETIRKKFSLDIWVEKMELLYLETASKYPGT